MRRNGMMREHAKAVVLLVVCIALVMGLAYLADTMMPVPERGIYV